VRVLTAYYMDEATSRFGLAARPAVTPDPEIEQLLRRDWTARLGDLGGPFEMIPILAIGRLSDPLLGHPAAVGAALHVVGNHRRGGVGRLSSVASGVLHLSRASVLLVPGEAASPAPDVFPRYRRILVATDGSAFADQAIRHAFGLVLDR